MTQRKSALSIEYLHPGSGALGSGVTRQVAALAVFVCALLFGAKLVDVLGPDGGVLNAVYAVLVGAGAVAGGVYHPIRRFWWRGSLAGALAILSSFLLLRVYSDFRPDYRGFEFTIVAFIGAIPGMVVYYFLMKNQVVGEREPRP